MVFNDASKSLLSLFDSFHQLSHSLKPLIDMALGQVVCVIVVFTQHDVRVSVGCRLASYYRCLVYTSITAFIECDLIWVLSYCRSPY